MLFETSEKRLNNFQTTHVNRSDKEQEDSCGQNVRKIPWAKCLEIYLDRMFEKFLGRTVDRIENSFRMNVKRVEDSMTMNTNRVGNSTGMNANGVQEFGPVYNVVREFGTVCAGV